MARRFVEDIFNAKKTVERIMKKVVAMIRSERAVVLKEHLSKIGITVITIADITAWAGPTKFALERRGIPVSYNLIHRAKVEIFISDDLLNQVVKAIMEITRTGEPGDGIIAVSNLEQIINISTLQEGENALRAF